MLKTPMTLSGGHPSHTLFHQRQNRCTEPLHTLNNHILINSKASPLNLSPSPNPLSLPTLHRLYPQLNSLLQTSPRFLYSILHLDCHMGSSLWVEIWFSLALQAFPSILINQARIIGRTMLVYFQDYTTPMGQCIIGYIKSSRLHLISQTCSLSCMLLTLLQCLVWMN